MNFFKLASIAFADIENKSLVKNALSKERMELIKYIERLGVLPRLRAFAVSTKHLGSDNSNKTDFFLLTLEIDTSNIQIRRFPAHKLDDAVEQYASREKEFSNNKDRDVVLVSAESLRGLRKAYPNYFADTSEFSRNIERIIEANKKIQPTAKGGG